jgi:hypothetical protein
MKKTILAHCEQSCARLITHLMLRKLLLASLVLLLASHGVTPNLRVVRGKNSMPSTPVQGWENVKLVPPGDKIVVSLKDGEILKGRLHGVSDTNLLLSQRNKVSDLARDRISRIHRLVSTPAAPSALLGAGIGAAAGLGAGSLSDDNKAVTMPGLAAIGAGVGALIGFIGNRRRKVLVYEA